jgi:hypothetical protein
MSLLVLYSQEPTEREMLFESCGNRDDSKVNTLDGQPTVLSSTILIFMIYV